MRKNISKIIVLFVITLLLGFNSAWADYFSLEVNYDGKNIEMRSETSDMLYKLENFLPGDKDVSYITIKNVGTEKVRVYLKDTEVITGNDSILDKLIIRITKNENVIFTGKYKDIQNIKLTEISSEGNEAYKIETTFSNTAGNEFQSKDFEIKFNFISIGDEIIIDEPTQNNIIENNIVNPPANNIVVNNTVVNNTVVNNIVVNNVVKPENKIETPTVVKKDNTVATTVLPKTGQSSLAWIFVFIIVIIVIVIVNNLIEYKYGKNINKILLNIILGAVIVLFVIVLVSVVKSKIANEDEVYILGFKPYVVQTGSMEPALETNGLVVVQKGKISDAKIGDIVNYKVEGVNLSICHRVVGIKEDGELITKGDNNNTEDMFNVSEKEYIGKVVFVSNNVGKVVANIKQNIVYYSIVLIIIVVSGIIIRIIVKKGKEKE